MKLLLPLVFIAGLSLLCLSACGKKAADVVLSDDGSVKDEYASTYPDVKTDPDGKYSTH